MEKVYKYINPVHAVARLQARDDVHSAIFHEDFLGNGPMMFVNMASDGLRILKGSRASNANEGGYYHPWAFKEVRYNFVRIQ